MITLLKMLPDKWEKAKGYLRLDLDRIETVLNQRWAVTFGDSNTLQPTVIDGDYTTDSRYVSNQGAGHAMKWDQINLANGVANTLKVTNGGTGTATAFTAGSVVFAGPAGVYAQDNANLFWDDTNNRLGIGITPLAKLDVKVDTDLVLRVRKTSSLVELYSANDANSAYVDLTIQNASLRLAAGNQFVGIALGAGPAARLHFKEETTDAGGIRFGDDAWIYRSAVGVVKITDSLLVFNRTTSNTFVIDPVGTGYIWFNGRALIKSPADSQITLFNTAETTFDRINFGGTSATDPALRREGSLLASKQADAADYTYFKAYEFFLTSGGYLMRSNANMTDGAGVALGTLANAPAAGNPTKWLKFDDNGTVRWIPAW